MNNIFTDSFVKAIKNVFPSIGLGEIAGGRISEKEYFTCTYNLTTIVGLSGHVKGNVALSMPYDTAKKIVSVMMMGMEVLEIDEMSVSALGEMTNMVCGTAAMELATQEIDVDITPPTLIHGDNMKAIISQVKTLAIELSSSFGNLELNLGLEI